LKFALTPKVGAPLRIDLETPVLMRDARQYLYP